MLNVEEDPTNKPNFAINELAGSKLLNLYKFIEQFGKNRVSALNLPASTSKTLIEHRDLVLVGTNRKMYILSLHRDEDKRSLMIADFRTKGGITRTMFFDGTTFQDSIKRERTGTSKQAQSSQLSKEEQLTFLNELKGLLVNVKATQELPIIPQRYKYT